MKLSQFKLSRVADTKAMRICLCSIFPAASLLCLVFFAGTAFISPDSKELSRMGVIVNIPNSVQSSDPADSMQRLAYTNCENLSSLSSNSTIVESKPNICEKCRPLGSESLPEGIVTATSNLERRPLWGFPKKNKNPVNLLALPVGIKQKVLVNEMVEKFLSSGFAVMLFHYDGNVDMWKEFEWSGRVIHVSAMNQTKWWFAKRFLHPDIVAEYDYIFLWDEDLGLDHFDPERYLSIVKKEGLEISQPGLDPEKSEMHHMITVRRRNSILHRRTYKPGGVGVGCDETSTAPPCTGWIEVMAPVFSRNAWRCVWYMTQNDLIHAWGLDLQLGYCAQGERTEKIGVVDAEYIIHHGLPTLGGDEKNKAPVVNLNHDPRVEVRRQSFIELDIFKKRWKKAADEDQCWFDPYQKK